MNEALYGKFGAGLLVAAAVGLSVGPEAEARSPATTSNITEVRTALDPEYPHPERARATRYVGINECETLLASEDRVFSVTFQAASGISLESDETFRGIYRYRLEAGEEQSVRCEEAERCVRISQEDYQYTGSQEVKVDVPFRELSGMSSPADCEEELLRNLYVQIQVRPLSTVGTTTEWSTAEGRVLFDLIRPEPPELVDAFATPFSVRVEYERSQSGDVRRHFVVVSSEPFEEGALPGEEGLTVRPLEGIGETGQATGLDLEQGTQVWVAVAARDEVGNYSMVSNAQEVTVTATRDFWDLYREAGGAEEGGYGCSAAGAPGPPMSLLVLLGLVGLLGIGGRRAKKKGLTGGKSRGFLSMVVVGAVLLSASVASAQDQRSRGTMEVKIGPYLPMVDAEFDGNGPYREFFGDQAMLKSEFAVDYHLWQGFGKLSAGAHLGYGRVQGRLLLDDGDALEGGERSTFRVIPVGGALIYRYDYSALNHGIPLVPVLKAGLDYYFWQVTTPAGETAVSGDGARAAGGRAGWHATAGLHLHLNFLDRRSAAAFRLNWGVRNSYLFGEYTWSRIEGFGTEGINLSADHWSVGLAFEF